MDKNEYVFNRETEGKLISHLESKGIIPLCILSPSAGALRLGALGRRLKELVVSAEESKEGQEFFQTLKKWSVAKEKYYLLTLAWGVLLVNGIFFFLYKWSRVLMAKDLFTSLLATTVRSSSHPALAAFGGTLLFFAYISLIMYLLGYIIYRLFTWINEKAEIEGIKKANKKYAKSLEAFIYPLLAKKINLFTIRDYIYSAVDYYYREGYNKFALKKSDLAFWWLSMPYFRAQTSYIGGKYLYLFEVKEITKVSEDYLVQNLDRLFYKDSRFYYFRLQEIE